MKERLDIIKSELPYSAPFLFVDELVAISNTGAKGIYTFKEDEYFYKGHFKGNPITPGVILIECMAQIGVVCFGIYLIQESFLENKLKDQIAAQKTLGPIKIALASSQIDFYLPVLPGERVEVISEKEYFRFGKLKCKVKMMNAKGELVCKGTISGMIAK